MIAGNKCSFVVDMDFGSDDIELKPSNTQVPNSQEKASKTSQPLRISLRVRGVPPTKMLDEGNLPQFQESKKRSSQNDMLAPKRVKRTREDSDVQVKKSRDNGSTMNETGALLATGAPVTRLRTPLKPLTNPPDTIRSDATTMTATTLDLDPVTPISSTNLLRIPPRQLEASLQPHGSNRQSDQENLRGDLPRAFSSRVVEKTSPNKYPSTIYDNAQEIYESFMTSNLNTFLKKDHNSQTDTLSYLCSIAIYNDDFLAFTKAVEHTWETGMFDGIS